MQYKTTAYKFWPSIPLVKNKLFRLPLDFRQSKILENYTILSQVALIVNGRPQGPDLTFVQHYAA